MPLHYHSKHDYGVQAKAGTAGWAVPVPEGPPGRAWQGTVTLCPAPGRRY